MPCYLCQAPNTVSTRSTALCPACVEQVALVRGKGTCPCGTEGCFAWDIFEADEAPEDFHIERCDAGDVFEGDDDAGAHVRQLVADLKGASR